MLRICILLGLMYVATGLHAQIPDGYYNGTEGLYREGLRSKLHKIIKGHTMYYYSSSETDTWDILKESDRDPNKSGNVILVYGGYSVSGPAEYPTWNREHVWAKSKGDFGTYIGPGTDLHNLKPSDESLNADRSNKSFDDGGWDVYDYSTPAGVSSPFLSGNKMDDNSWEPRDEVKGDIARIIFYMDVRYDGDDGFPDLQMVDQETSVYSKDPYHGKKSTLLKWHEQDPPDDFERNRNNVIFSYQNNRNPFIDHPEFVNAIWGENAAFKKMDVVENKVYFSKGHLVCENKGNETALLQVFSLAGKQIYQTSLEAGELLSKPASKFPGLIIVKLADRATKVSLY